MKPLRLTFTTQPRFYNGKKTVTPVTEDNLLLVN